MAERRMFAKTIIDSDAFLDMPTSTQALYFHLAMRADDDGFVNNPKKIQRVIGCSDDDMKLLIVKSFIIPFESGVVVIKHWKIHNFIRNDRYKPTVYSEEFSMLQTKENKAYTFGIPDDNQRYTVGIPNGNQMDTQVRLVQDSSVQDRIVQDRIASTTTIEEVVEEKLSTTVQKVELSTVAVMLENMMLQYWKRKPTDKDMEMALKYITDADSVQMLANALELSGRREEAANWAYVRAIYDSWKRNGITNDLELIQHEIARRDGLK